MKVLVTGGAGFIASHITDALIEAGHEVLIVDNLSTGKREFLNPNAKFVEADIRNENLLNIFQDFRPQVVYHEAAQIDVHTSIKTPMVDVSTNIMAVSYTHLDVYKRQPLPHALKSFRNHQYSLFHSKIFPEHLLHKWVFLRRKNTARFPTTNDIVPCQSSCPAALQIPAETQP